MFKDKKFILYFVLVALVLAVGVVYFFKNSRTSFEDLSVGISSDGAPGFGMEKRTVTAQNSLSAVVEYNEGSTAEDAGTMQDRLIIRTGSMSIVVQDVRESVGKITEYAEANEGFVVSSNIYESGVIPTANITVRIPVEKFSKSVNEMKSLGEVKNESVSGQDITEEYVDLDAQFRNLKATEEQFLTIMKRAVKIEDVLAVQRELSDVRSNIERIEGRMKYLKQSASLSTLSIDLSSDPSALPVIDDNEKWKPFGTLKDAVRSLLDTLKGFVDIIIWFVVYIPVIVIHLAIAFAVYWAVKRIYLRVRDK